MVSLQPKVPFTVLLGITAGMHTLIDFTLHCVQVIRRAERLVLEEATHKEGELVGSTLVDEIVKQSLAASLPRGVWAEWKHKHPNQFVKIVHDTFESQKCAFDGTAPLKIELHNSLLNMIPQEVSWRHQVWQKVTDVDCREVLQRHSVRISTNLVLISRENDPACTLRSAMKCISSFRALLRQSQGVMHR